MRRLEQAPAAALVLAAGASRRLGKPKQLLLHGGEPLLRRAVRLALAAGTAPVLVILNPGQTGMVAALSGLPAVCVPNRDASEGMGSSLRIGTAALQTFYPSVERLLVLVSDQPLLRPEHIRALLAPEPPAAAAYNGRLGVPAVFAKQHFPALAAMRGDQGARALLARLGAAPVPMPEAAMDVDSPADEAALSETASDF